MPASSRTAKQMVQEALALLPQNNYEAAELLGVSEATIRNWRGGEMPAQLRGETRRAVERFLSGEAKGANGNGNHGAGTPEDMPPDVLRELWRRLDAIDAMPGLTHVQREARRESELAAVRESIQHAEARAAERRARALELESEKAPQRGLGINSTQLDAALRAIEVLGVLAQSVGVEKLSEGLESTDAPPSDGGG